MFQQVIATAKEANVAALETTGSDSATGKSQHNPGYAFPSTYRPLDIQ